MGRLLQRLGIVKKQGRIGLHSPDADYQAKLTYLKQCWDEALADPAHVHFLYLDEFSYYRQPTLAPAAATISGVPICRIAATRAVAD